VNFPQAIKMGFRKYATFQGSATPFVGLVPFFGSIIWFGLMLQPSGPNVFWRKPSPLRMPSVGLIDITLGVVMRAGIYIRNSFHPIPSLAGLWAAPVAFIFPGLIFFLIGWQRRNKTDSSSRP
jgi:hypothetical protein